MDRMLSYIVRLVVWFSGFAKPLSRLGLFRYDEWHKGKPLKGLLVGYNGARNTGADARVVALTRQLEEVFEGTGFEGTVSEGTKVRGYEGTRIDLENGKGTLGDEQKTLEDKQKTQGDEKVELTVITLSTDNIEGYFSSRIRLWRFTTVFFWSLLRAASQCHVAVLCEGSTLTRTFADALCVFYCEAAGIMRRQKKPCIAYGSEVGRVDGWLARLSSDLCRDTYFMVRTEESLQNLKALGLHGHVGTDTAWTFRTPEGEQWADSQLRQAGWDGQQPLLGVAVLNPFCWPVRPSLGRWMKAIVTGNHEQQYDKMYFFSDSEERRRHFNHYIGEMATAVNRYQRAHNAFVVVLGMEQLDTRACHQIERLIEGPHAVFASQRCDVFQMTGLLRCLSVLVTSRYHAAVLSMEHRIPIVAVSMDARLSGVMSETGLAGDYLFTADDRELGSHITAALQHADEHRDEIAQQIDRHLDDYKQKVDAMTHFFTTWLRQHFS